MRGFARLCGRLLILRLPGDGLEADRNRDACHVDFRRMSVRGSMGSERMLSITPSA